MLLAKAFSTRAILCWAFADPWKLSVTYGGLKFRDLAVTGNTSTEHGAGGGALLLLFGPFSAPHLLQQVLVVQKFQNRFLLASLLGTEAVREPSRGHRKALTMTSQKTLFQTHPQRGLNHSPPKSLSKRSTRSAGTILPGMPKKEPQPHKCLQAEGFGSRHLLHFLRLPRRAQLHPTGAAGLVTSHWSHPLLGPPSHSPTRVLTPHK